jgi:hypothetical protein
MAKIWEIDFTSFSGSGPGLYDLTSGGGNLLTYTGTINIQNPLIGFSNRKGVYFSQQDQAQAYFLYYNAGSINIPKARFSAAYNYRSFVMWIYPVGLGDTDYWDTGGGYREGIWCDSDAPVGSNPCGFASTGGGGSIELYNYGTTAIVSAGGIVTNNEWHLLVATIDRITPKVQLFLDGKLVSTNLVTVMGTTTPTKSQIGDNSSTREGSYYLGYTATYDTILTSGQVQAIYDSFLVDSVAGDAYYQTFSGQVFNNKNEPVPSADIRAYHLVCDEVVSKTTTSGDGSFFMILPYSGTYVILTEDAPYGGTNSFPVIATSGGVYFP